MPTALSRRRLRRPVLPLVTALLSACELGTLPPGVSSEAALSLTHLCADSFRIVNRYVQNSPHPLQVRITASWSSPGSRVPQTALGVIQVPWAATLSDSGLVTFRLPIPLDRAVHLHATATGAPFTGKSRSLSIPGGTTCSTAPQVRLRSALGFGVQGTILPTTDSVPVGTELRWHLSPTSGFERVEVRINGQPALPQGSLRLTEETTITAVGTVTPAIPAPLRPLITAAHALLDSPTPGPDAEKLVNQLLALLAAASAEEAEQLLDTFAQHAIPEAADPDAVVRLDEALADVMLRIERPGPASLRDDSPIFPRERATHVVAAGILTPQDKLVATTRVVQALMRDGALLGAQDLVRGFVSPTMTGIKEDARQCVVRTLSPRSITERANAFLTHCLLLYGNLIDGIDFAEATSQILRQWLGVVPPRRTSLAFKDSLLRYRDRGDHLLITAHSQGTLISREALAELTNEGFYRGSSDSTCVGTVAMAGPVSGGWTIPTEYVDEFATDGDLVASLGGSSARRIPTDLTRERDSAMRTLPTSARMLRVGVYLAYALRLHDLQGVYLGETPPRNHLLASLGRLRRECEVAAVTTDISDNHLKLIQGEEIPLAIYFNPQNHHGRRLLGRPVRLLEASSPTLAILGGFSLRAVTPGQGQVVASTRGVKTTMQVTVVPPPSLGLTGEWTGHWRLPAPAIGGEWSMTLSEAGEANRDGQILVNGTVHYTHPNGSYSTPMIEGLVKNGAPNRQLVFRMATPEFTDRYAYAIVTLDLLGNRLSGGTLHHYGGGTFRESRIITLNRVN